MCGNLAFGKLLRLNEAMKVGTCPLAFYKRKRPGLRHSVWPMPSRNPHQMQPPVLDLSAFRTMKSISFYSLNQSWYYYSSRKCFKTTYSGNQGEDQQSKGTCHQDWWLEFNSRGPNGGRREPGSCKLSSDLIQADSCACTHTHPYKINTLKYNKELKKKKSERKVEDFSRPGTWTQDRCEF